MREINLEISNILGNSKIDFVFDQVEEREEAAAREVEERRLEREERLRRQEQRRRPPW